MIPDDLRRAHIGFGATHDQHTEFAKRIIADKARSSGNSLRDWLAKRAQGLTGDELIANFLACWAHDELLRRMTEDAVEYLGEEI